MGLFGRELKSGRISYVYDFQYTYQGIVHRPVLVCGVVPKTLAKAMAQKFRIEKIAEIHGLRPPPTKPQPTPILISEAAETWLRDYVPGHRPGSVKHARYSLKKLMAAYGDKALSALTLSDLEALKQSESVRPVYPGKGRYGLADATVDEDVTFWRLFCRSAVDRGWIEKDPAAKLKGLTLDNERTRVLSHEEEARMLAVMPPIMRPLITVALQTGLRPGECRGMRWKDINWRQAVLTIPSRRRKQRKMHLVPLNQAVMEVLVAQRTAITGQADPEGVVFWEIPGIPWTRNRWQRMWYALVKAADIIDFRPHDLRHTFATRILEAGYGIETVQELLGHASITQTRRYVHVTQTRVRDAVNALGRITSPDTTLLKSDVELSDKREKSNART